MIFVTGSKRSGTSMWMQILGAAGFPLFGVPYMADWRRRLGALNERGFFESRLREGVHFLTNPDPVTGEYLSPELGRGAAVKVFVPGVVRSDLAYVECVLATMRSFRDQNRSLERLRAVEHAAREEAACQSLVREPMPPAAYVWWRDQFDLVADHTLRGYPLRFVAYESVVADPERAIAPLLAYLGAGELAPAVAAVDERLRTYDAGIAPPPEATSEPDVDLPSGASELFDELHDHVVRGRVFEAPFVAALNALDDALRERFGQRLRTAP